MSLARPTHAWIKPVPNLISAFRIALAIWFPFAAPELRLAIVATAGVSDGIDGFIARRFDATSWQGGLLDAVADKLFTTVALVTLTVDGTIVPFHLPLLMMRDLVVASASAVVAARRRWGDFKRMQSRLAGKATTFLLFGTMGALLVPLPELVVPLVGLSITSSFAAAVDYARTFKEGAP